MKVNPSPSAPGNAAQAPDAPAQAAETTAVSGAASAGDGLEKAPAAATEGAVPQAPIVDELTQLRETIKTHIKTLAGDFPELGEGAGYYLKGDTFCAPLNDAIERARRYGVKMPRDFVVGEVAVQHSRATLGYSKTDMRIANNPAMRLLIELVETVAAARTASAAYPGVLEPVQTYLAKVWTNIAEQSQAAGAPPLLRSFVLTLIAEPAGTSAPKLKEHTEEARALIEEARLLFVELTKPAAADEIKRLQGDRGAADKAATGRVDCGRTELWPLMERLLRMELPEPELPKAAVAPDKARADIVTGDQAAEKARARRRRKVAEAPKPEAILAEHNRAAESLVSLLKHDTVARRWNLLDNPTPSLLRRAHDLFVEQGRLRPSADADAVIERALKILLKDEGSDRFASFATQREELPPWSLRKMRALAGADPLDLLHASRSDLKAKSTPAITPSYGGGIRGGSSRDDRWGVGGLGAIYTERAATTQAQSWVEQAKAQFESLREAGKLASSLSRCDGVTAEIAKLLQSAQAKIGETFDKAREEARNPGFRFNQAKEEFETALGYHARLVETISAGAASGGSMLGRLGKLLSAGAVPSFEQIVEGGKRAAEAQVPARELVQRMIATYPEATASLAEVIGERMAWWDRAAGPTASGREKDPLLSLIDASWLPVVAAELRRSEALAKRVHALASSVPEDVPGKAGIRAELGLAGNLAAMLVGETSERLARELSGAGPGRARRERSGVATTRSYALPALARFPRLMWLVQAAKAGDSDLGTRSELEKLADLAARPTSEAHAAYDIGAKEREDAERVAGSRADYAFWSRTFDLDASPRAFLQELAGWHTYHAPALETFSFKEHPADALTRDFLDLVQRGDVPHAIPDPTGDELATARFQAKALGRTIATSDKALDDLRPLLDPAKQPVAVLEAAAAELAKAKDRDAAAALVRPWLSLSSAPLRRAAMKALAQLQGSDAATVTKQLLSDTGAPLRARAFAVRDGAKGLSAEKLVSFLAPVLAGTEPLLRILGTHELAEAASRGGALSTLASPLAERLRDQEPHVVQFAIEGLSALVRRGSSEAAEKVVAMVQASELSDPRIADLLQLIGTADKISEKVAISARGAALVFERESKLRETRLPRPISLAVEKPPAPKSHTSELLLSAAQVTGEAPQSEAELTAVSDRLKLALRLVTKFEAWAQKSAPAALQSAFEKLDLSDGILDDAMAVVTGGKPRGYLKGQPRIAEAMLGASGFSAAEIEMLVNGDLPPVLRELAAHPLAKDNAWRSTTLASLNTDADAYRAALTLKRWLDDDRTQIVGQLVSDLLGAGASQETRAVAYEALRALVGSDVPLLDPALDEAAKLAALATTGRPTGAFGELLEEAVLARFVGCDASSAEARLLLAYLGSGKSEVGSRSLATALERATGVEHVKLLLEVCGERTRKQAAGARSTLTNMAASANPWIFRVLDANPNLSPERVLIIRDAVVDARETSATPSDVSGVEQRIVTVMNAALDSRSQPNDAAIATFGAIVADSDTDRSRQMKMEGLVKLLQNPRVDWNDGRADALRKALVIAAENLQYGDAPGNFQTLLDLYARVLSTRPTLTSEEIVKLGEMYAACPTSTSKNNLTEELSKLYRQVEHHQQKIDLESLQTLQGWFAAYDQGKVHTDREAYRGAVLKGLGDLVPLPVETLRNLAEACAGMSPVETAEVLKGCAAQKRVGTLTEEDIKKIGLERGGVQRPSSRFRDVIGKSFSTLAWQPSDEARFTDPIALKFGEAENVERAKLRLRKGINDIMTAMNVRMIEATEPLARPTDLSTRSFGLGAWARRASEEEESKGTKQLDNPFVLHNLSSQAKEAQALSEQFKKERLERLPPYERLLTVNRSPIISLARGVSDIFQTVITNEKRWSTEAGELNVQRFMEAQIHREAAMKKLRESGDKGGGAVAMEPIFEVQLRAHQATKRPRFLMIFLIDNSGSTKEGDRLDYFVQTVAINLEALENVTTADFDTAVVSFSDAPRLLLPIARRHDPAAKSGALLSLKPDNGTNDVAGLLHVGKMVDPIRHLYDGVAVMVFTDGKGQNNMPAVVLDSATKHRMAIAAAGVSDDAKFVGDTYNASTKSRSMLENDPSRMATSTFLFIKDEVIRGLR